jgi:hypothetical protein
MGKMMVRSLRDKECPDELVDVLQCRYNEITLPMLGATLFEQGLVSPTWVSISPIDKVALGDIGYVTEAGNFVVVDNIDYRLQAESGGLSCGVDLPVYSGRWWDTYAKDIVSKGGNTYHRRRQVYFSV